MDIIAKSMAPHLPLLKRVHAFAAQRKICLYMVGGVLRDIYLRRERKDPDMDFCVSSGAVKFGRSLAKHLSAGFVVLDETHGCCRVVIRGENAAYTLDISDFRGDCLEEDLRLRDFTVNTLCIKLSDLVASGAPSVRLIDIHGAVGDIRRKRFSIMYPRAFDDDPVRILRAFCLKNVYGLTPSPDILRLISRKKNLIKKVSGERIRDELFKILACPSVYAGLSDLDAYGILEMIFPEIKPMKKALTAGKTRIDVWKHSLDTVRELGCLIKRICNRGGVAPYISRTLSGGRSVRPLLFLAAMLHDAGKPETYRFSGGKVSFYGHERSGSRKVADICSRLKLSNEEARAARRITFLHLRPGYLAVMPQVSPRAVFRFFRDAGDESAAILLLALADERATSGYTAVEKIRPRYERLIFRLIGEYFKKKAQAPGKKLFDGHDIMKIGGLKPSALVGKVLRELDESRAVGDITTRKEALDRAKEIIAGLKTG